jgi:hypothetical protein
MDPLLSLAQAARMIGVRRSVLQQHVQEGRLSTFEGAVRLSALLAMFPEAGAAGSAMLEKVQRFQEGALQKPLPASRPDPERLAAEVHRLRLELGVARTELGRYQALTEELKDHLYALQDQCDQRQRLLLGTLITWVARKTQRRG